jgi:hypothetical protein
MRCPPADPDAHHDFSLSRRLDVTRGSFYHHFRNREDFVRTLLAAWEEDYMEHLTGCFWPIVAYREGLAVY